MKTINSTIPGVALLIENDNTPTYDFDKDVVWLDVYRILQNNAPDFKWTCRPTVSRDYVTDAITVDMHYTGVYTRKGSSIIKDNTFEISINVTRGVQRFNLYKGCHADTSRDVYHVFYSFHRDDVELLKPTRTFTDASINPLGYDRNESAFKVFAVNDDVTQSNTGLNNFITALLHSKKKVITKYIENDREEYKKFVEQTTTFDIDCLEVPAMLERMAKKYYVNTKAITMPDDGAKRTYLIDTAIGDMGLSIFKDGSVAFNIPTGYIYGTNVSAHDRNEYTARLLRIAMDEWTNECGPVTLSDTAKLEFAVELMFKGYNNILRSTNCITYGIQEYKKLMNPEEHKEE